MTSTMSSHDDEKGHAATVADKDLASGTVYFPQTDVDAVLTTDSESVSDKHDATPDTSTTSSIPQDGGLRAWLQVVGAFFVFANVWGFTFAFGSFQSYYEIEYLPNEAPSTIAWIGTTTTFLLILIGVIAGPLFDLGYFKTMLIGGAAIATIAAFLISISHTFWALMLTQGVMFGLGNGVLFLPGIALVNRAFEKNRAIAMALAMTGAPVGGIMYTVIFEQLIGRLEFGWTMRAMAFVILTTFCIAIPLLLFRANNMGDLAEGSEPRKLFDKGALMSTPFWAWSLSNFLTMTGYIVPYAFFPSYGQLVLGMSRTSALNVLLAAQGAAVVGRLVVGATATKIGIIVPWIACVAVSSSLCFVWIAVKDPSGLYAVAICYGFFSSPLTPLPPAVFPRVCPDRKVFGARFGMGQAFNSIGNLIGAPVAAAVASASSTATQASYLGLQLYCGGVMMLGGLLLFWLWAELLRRRPAGTSIWI